MFRFHIGDFFKETPIRKSNGNLSGDWLTSELSNFQNILNLENLWIKGQPVIAKHVECKIQ